MSDPSFDRISKYCLEHGKDFPVRNFALAICTEKTQSAIENHKEQHNGIITPDVEETIVATFIAENQLRAHVAEAERSLRAMEEDFLRRFGRRSRRKDFWWSTFASIVGAFLFSVLMFLLFVIAEDQIRPVVRGLLTEEHVEQPINQGQTAEPQALPSHDQ